VIYDTTGKDAEIASMRQKMEDMACEFGDMLKETLDRMRERIEVSSTGFTATTTATSSTSAADDNNGSGNNSAPLQRRLDDLAAVGSVSGDASLHK
jgi:hypothetical protein